jgi:hypothetical protein
MASVFISYSRKDQDFVRWLHDALKAAPVIVRYATLAGWQAQACAIADRNLTTAEWNQFVSAPGTSYSKTCPDLPAG